MSINNESMILSGLLNNEQYFRKVLPYIKEEYFTTESSKILFKIINNYASKYKEKPNTPIIKKTICDGLSNKGAEFLTEINNKLVDIDKLDLPDSTDYMVDETEKFCQNQAMYLAISKAIEIYDSQNSENKKPLDIGAIPDIVKNALAVSFNTSIGHDYDNGAEDRWDYYTLPEAKIPFEIDKLNDITNNGVLRKTLNLFVAGVNVGKTMLLVYLAAMYKRMGYNVLYITNEVNEFEISKRVDASLLNIETDMLTLGGKEKYLSRFDKLKETARGRLIVKEFPTGTCSANRIRALLHELEIKKKFKPDIIINDYITINRADGVTFNGNTGQYFEFVAEQMRALAVEFDLVMWSAAQFNSEGIKGSDPELTDIGSSLGIGKVADFCIAAIRNPALDDIGQITFKQMKTRYHKIRYQRFNLGIDIGTQRLFSVDDSSYVPPKNDNFDDDVKVEFKTSNNKKKVLKI